MTGTVGVGGIGDQNAPADVQVVEPALVPGVDPGPMEEALVLDEVMPTPLSPKGRRRVLTASTLSWFLIAICTLGLSPVYPNIAHDLGLTPSEFGLLLGLYTLVSGVLQIPLGAVADRVDLRRIIVVGLIMSTAAPILWATAPNFWFYAIGQVSMGVAIVCLQAGCHTALAKAYPLSKRSAALSGLWVASSAGQAASLILFGVAGGHFGWRVVALSVCWLPLLALPLVGTMPEVAAPDVKKSIRAVAIESRRYFRNARAIAVAGIAALIAGASIAVQFLIPFMLRAHSYGPAATGLLLIPLIVGGIVGSPAVGWLADRFGATRCLVTCFAIGTASLLLMAGTGAELFVLGVCLFILGVLTNGSQAVMIGLTADLANQIGGIGTGAALGVTRLCAVHRACRRTGDHGIPVPEGRQQRDPACDRWSVPWRMLCGPSRVVEAHPAARWHRRLMVVERGMRRRRTGVTWQPA